MEDLIGQHIGQYEIIARLGEGGMAIVYRAIQPSMRRDVAIKIIKRSLVEKSEFVSRFEREARAAAGLSHPFILKVFDYGQQGDLAYLVMELLTGGSLTDLIRRGPLSPEQMVQVLDQMASALDYAHKKGVIHRDLKPQNVLLDEAGNAHLTDFGIAKLMDDGIAALTQTGVVMGTPAYMAPEQWQGKPVDARVDLYALGVMLFEMLTGRVPFTADTPFSLMHMHVYDPPPSIRVFRPALPPRLEQVVEKALAKDPDQRFQSAVELASAFRAALSDQTGPEVVLATQRREEKVTASPTAVELPLKPPRRTRRTLAGFGVAALTIAIIGLLVMALSGRLGGTQTTATVGVSVKTTVTEVPTTPPATSVTLTLIPTATPVLPTATMPTATSTATNTPAVTPTSTPVPPTITATATAMSTLTSTPVPLPAGSERFDATGTTMVYVPAGCFLMGSDAAIDSKAEPGEQPQHNVCIAHGFWIDKYEVTNEAYQKFVDNGGYRLKEYWSAEGWQWKGSRTGPQDYDGFNDPQKPRIGITWYEAEAYAKWRGGRLPTEAEWEYAARGKDGRIYPWGNTFDGTKLNYCDKNCTETGHDLNVNDGYKFTAPVGSYPDGKSWANAYDMVGNIWEWVGDWYDEAYYQKIASVDPAGPSSGTLRGLRGGSWFDTPRGSPLRAAQRQAEEPDSQWENLGVRVMSLAPVGLTETLGNTAPLNSNLALGKLVTASKSAPGQSAQAVVDGVIDFPNAWGAADFPPQWIEINLEAAATVTEIRLRVQQSPNAQTVHQVLGRGPTEEFHLLNEFSGFTVDGQWLSYVPPVPWTGIQFIRVVTTKSPSWVAWREIQIVGTFN